MAAMDPLTVTDVDALVRRAAPFTGLPPAALESVLDMLAGRYPSDEFAELRPRLVWDRVTGELTPRRSAQRLAVTSGGTIPDRGMFGVFLASAEDKGRRVGELDEEMVYESRVGDVFLLGSSSWRIEDITPDRVLVSPAPGQVGRMPFWKGDAPGRPAELGRAHGAFLREISAADEPTARGRAARAGLDEWGTTNLLTYLREQREAAGHLPDDRTLLVERFRDELGDWRLVVHSPFGAPVNAPWALLIAARLRERHGLDVATMHTDDGIVLRLPETDADPPGADLAVFEPEEIEPLVTSEVSGSALFASRFRECAARALLLPRRDPRRRTALWQQRQRANQLLQVAAQYGEFPIVLETMRECLQDVYDVPGLRQIMADLRARRLHVVEVETQTPSPFARSVMFGFVGMFIYDSDAPLAERRAQALSLDSSLLAELLGSAELRELLDADAIAQVAAEVGRLAPARRAFGFDGVHDLLREVGDLTTAEALARGATTHELAELEAQRRAIRVRISGEERWLAIEDAGRVRDALGTALPVGVPEAFTEPVQDPLGDLVGRYARTHGPFMVVDVATRLGLGVAVVDSTLRRLEAGGRVVFGEFSPGGAGREWCDAEVLRRIRRRSLAALRHEVEPVPPRTLGRFLPAWQGVSPHETAPHGTLRTVGETSGRGHGRDAVLRVVEQLAGVPVPASSLEATILPSRLPGYQPADLDALTAAGEVVWCGAGALPGHDGWVALAPAEAADVLLPLPAEADGTELEEAVLAALDGDQALFFRTIAERAGQPASEVAEALWSLVWASVITNDTFAPVRDFLAGSRRTARAGRQSPRYRSRYRAFASPAAARAPVPAVAGASSASTGGRWSRVPAPDRDPTRRGYAAAEVLLDRHGLVTRGAVVAERLAGGFAAVYPVLAAAEEAGRARRGYFVDGLGAAQFATTGAVERLRPMATGAPAPALVLAATDPANPYGAALPWPSRATEDGGRGHQPGRKAGALVVLVDGACCLYVERGGKTLLSFTDDRAELQPAADALALAVRDGLLGKLAVERADGTAVVNSPAGDALEAAGFRPTPRGLRLRA
jgi:ATP-dependent Lhr-like helicase